MQPIQSVGNFIYAAANKAKEATISAVSSVLGLFNLWLHRAWRGAEVADSNVVVVLTATNDHNSALSFPHPINSYQLHHHKDIKIIYRKVSSIEEIEQTLIQIKGQNNRIKGLWIHAHGSSSGFSLGAQNDTSTHRVANCEVEYKNDVRIGSGNAKKLQAALQTLEEDASIILASCLTARINSDGAPSIAQTIAQLAPHRRIYAATEKINGAALQFAWDKDQITARFTAPMLSSGTRSLFYELVHVLSGGYVGRDITAVIKSYPNR